MPQNLRLLSRRKQTCKQKKDPPPPQLPLHPRLSTRKHLFLGRRWLLSIHYFDGDVSFRLRTYLEIWAVKKRRKKGSVTEKREEKKRKEIGAVTRKNKINGTRQWRVCCWSPLILSAWAVAGGKLWGFTELKMRGGNINSRVGELP